MGAGAEMLVDRPALLLPTGMAVVVDNATAQRKAEDEQDAGGAGGRHSGRLAAAPAHGRQPCWSSPWYEQQMDKPG